MNTLHRLLVVTLACSVLWGGCTPGDSAPQDSAPDETLVIKGSVRLPDFQNLESLGEGAVFRERPAGDVSVVLRRGSDTQGVVGEARTDADGNWEVSVDPELPLDGSVVAEATVDGTTLRRAIVTEFGNAVTIRSEALGRMLQQRRTSPVEISRATYLNLLSMLATAADLTTPVDWSGGESVEQAVDRVGDAGRTDERLGARLEALGEET